MPRRKRKGGGGGARAVVGRERWPLSEKYAPFDESELCVYNKTVARVREWIERSQGGLLVLAGRPGVGKSTTVEVVCASLGIEVRRWRDTHGIGGWRGGPVPYESREACWRDFANGALYPDLQGGASLLLIDDLPPNPEAVRGTLRALSSEAPRAAVLVWSQNVLEKSDARPVVEKILGPIDFEYVEFNAVTENKVASRLRAIAAAERRHIPNEAIDAIARDSDGDLRRAITRLDFATRGRSRLPDSDDGDSRASDLHAIGRLLRAKRDHSGALAYDPERLVERATMNPDALSAFLQFNCVHFFLDEDDLAEALDTFSDADLFAARLWSPDRDSADAVHPEAYLASLAARASSTANRRPAPGAWRPVRKPKYYDLRRRTFLRIPHLLCLPPALVPDATTTNGAEDGAPPRDDDDDDDDDVLADDDIEENGVGARSEAYATLVYSPRDGRESRRTMMYVCSAAVLGRELAKLDRKRDRVAIVTGLSGRAEAVVESSWTLVRRPRTEQHLRKHALWSLPYDRILFFDSDVVIPSGGRSRAARLEALWGLPSDDELRAFAVKNGVGRRASCFNSGFMLLRPGKTVPVSEDGGCPGHDQKSLNAAFATRWTPIPASMWVMLRLSNATRRQLRRVVEDSGKFDAYHLYFSTTATRYARCGDATPRSFREAAERAVMRAWRNATAHLEKWCSVAC
ncbi:hypothetical protein CTAYLR_009310 [Chrysophaeum taylorii]|uniref:AAA+ ATPase domain-containing protein n=1 Tax=Chrysophaeum taylorii TaxID=2483200 RepID=A0AAD7UJF6_9STRA|nr:hypothetical protein CTAYLR_009310 [Chrysophaeum taylorii]